MYIQEVVFQTSSRVSSDYQSAGKRRPAPALIDPALTRLVLLCKPQLMHPPMNGHLRLQERSFQIRFMVLLSVVVGDRPRLISWTQLADVGQTAVDQRQHMLRRLLVEEPPVIATGHVDRRGVCHYPTPPDIMMQDRIGVTGTAYTRGQPGVAVHLDPRLQLQPTRAHAVLGRLDHASLLDDLK